MTSNHGHDSEHSGAGMNEESAPETDACRSESELTEAEARYRALVEYSPVGVYVVDRERFVYVNPRFARMLGYSEEELLSSVRVSDTIAPEDRGRFIPPEPTPVLNRETPMHFAFRGIRKDGSSIELEVYGTIAVISGKPAIVGTAFDVTDQKLAEQAVKESEEKFRMLSESAEAAIGIIQGKHLVYVNPYLERASEYAYDDLMRIDVADLIHPGDRQMVMDRLQRRLAGEKLVSHYEFRMVTRTGRERWMEISPARIVYRGRPAIVGIAYDVTERKMAVEALRRSEARFRAVFDEAPAALMITDTSGLVLQVNSAFQQFTGRSKEQVVGYSVYDAVSSPEDQRQAREITERVALGESVQNVLWSPRRPDGRQVFILTNVVPLCNDRGEVEAILSLGTDITDRLLAEQHDREIEEQKRDFYRRTIMAATEGKLAITESEKIREKCGPPVAAWRLREYEQMYTVRQDVRKLAADAGMDEDRVYDFVLCVGEAITNAVKHANGGDASLHLTDGVLCFVVSDRGPGIDALALPELALKRGYSTAVSLGMGYKTMISVADAVYLATGPGGTTVGIEMKLHQSREASNAAQLPDTWRTRF